MVLHLYRLKWAGVRMAGGEARGDRGCTCKQCDNDEMEDMCHWMVECNAFDSVREPLLNVI